MSKLRSASVDRESRPGVSAVRTPISDQLPRVGSAPDVAEESGVRARTSAPSPRRSRCADQIVDVLVDAGVDTVYGVPGGAISTIYDALIDCPSIRVVHVRHETNALFMAIGHTRMLPGSLPCVLVTSGPGVTNAVTGLAAALGEGVPVIVIGGEVPRVKFGRAALQEGSPEGIDVVNIVRTVTRSAEHLSMPSRAGYQVAAAARRARRLNGPVFLSLPLDVATAPSTPMRVGAIEPAAELPDAGALAKAARALRDAKRPILLLGSGARDAATEVRQLAERFNIPVITSPKAKGIVSEQAPYCLGVFGYGGHPSTHEWLQAHPPDVVLALGCGLNEPSTNSWSPLLQASRVMIQVDLDPAQFGRNYRTDLGLEGDCAQVVRALAGRLDRAPWGALIPGTRYLPLLRERRSEQARGALDPAAVLAVLQEEMPEETTYTSDIGEHLLFAIHCVRATRPDQFIASLSLGSMGSGIGAAIGAKLAAPDRPVVSISGDFGFQMFGMDLSTCVQEGLGVIFLVLNDGRMRMVEAGIARNYGRGLPMDGPPVDFAALARAHDTDGFLVETLEGLRWALRHTSADRPAIIDVRIDPNAMFPVNPRAQEISNFTAK